MNPRSILLTAALLTLGHALRAQTADLYIASGRGYLAVSNLVAANNSFSNAVTVSPGNPTGNVFYAATRLLTWPIRPMGSNFLTRLGVPNVGRDLYNWTALPPQDTNGLPPPPAGVNAADFPAMLRTNLLTELIGAEANLAKVTDPNFILGLTSSETRTVAVTLDYGDIQLLRAMLQAAECYSYTAYSLNLDAPLAPLYSLYTSNSVERVLAEHPALLTFATTNDLAAAKAALLVGADRYDEASQFIRNRPTNVVRLFNYDPERADDEANFRQTLADFTNSLTHAVTLAVNSNYVVFLGSQFSNPPAPRSFLPVIRGNGFGLGTLPDSTFGGLIYSTIPGVVEVGVEEFLANSGLFPIPTIAPGLTRAGLQFQFPINTLKNRGYAVEVSTNLQDWATSYAFFSFANGHTFADTNAYAFPRRFYRIVDRTEAMPPPPNDNFANRIPLTGLGFLTYGYNASATTELGEPGSPWNTVWWSWTAPVSGLVVVGAEGTKGWQSAQIYTGNSLNNLTAVTNANYVWPYQYSGFPFNAIAGTTYHIQVSGDPGGIRLVITAPPILMVGSPRDGAASPVPTNFTISVSAASIVGQIDRLACYTDGTLFGSTANSLLSMTWSNVAVGGHSIRVEATDNLGVSTYSNLTVYVRPSNDNFANRIPITGSSASVTGTNNGASKEPGEPDHTGYAGGASVWWSWTSPFTGYITLSADLVADWGYLQPDLLDVYTGTSVSNLTLVASHAAPSWETSAGVSFFANAGVTYQIAVDGQYGNTGLIALRLIPTQAPVVSITWPANYAQFSAPTNLTIIANAHDGDGTITRVDLYNQYTLIGSATNAPYTAVLNSPVGGSCYLLAKATDNMGASTWSAPVYFYIQPPPFWVSLSSPAQGEVYTAPANIPITASVFDPDGIVTQVRFSTSPSTIIGTATRSPYSMIWSNMGPGYYTITAEAEDNRHLVVLSDPVDFIVNYPEMTLTLGVPTTSLSGGIGSDSYFKLTVPSGATSLQISTSGGVGDCNLYVAYDYQPNLLDYDYCPFLDGNNETVTIPNPAAGDWHIMLDGYNSYNGVTLLAQ
jgi:hypothetical protein